MSARNVNYRAILIAIAAPPQRISFRSSPAATEMRFATLAAAAEEFPIHFVG